MGNTCFSNCIIQSMAHNPLLRTYFLSGAHKRSPKCICHTLHSASLIQPGAATAPRQRPSLCPRPVARPMLMNTFVLTAHAEAAGAGIKEGDTVLVLWRDSKLYPAAVTAVRTSPAPPRSCSQCHDDACDVQFEDGSSEAAVPHDRIRPLNDCAVRCILRRVAMQCSGRGGGCRGESGRQGRAQHLPRLRHEPRLWVCCFAVAPGITPLRELYSGKPEPLAPYQLLHCVWQVRGAWRGWCMTAAERQAPCWLRTAGRTRVLHCAAGRHPLILHRRQGCADHCDTLLGAHTRQTRGIATASSTACSPAACSRM